MTSAAAALLGVEDHTIVLTRGRPLISKPSQRVRLVWNATVDHKLKRLAQETLAIDLPEESLEIFPEVIRQQVPSVLERAFDGVASIEWVEDDGDDVHSIHFLEFNGSIFGRSPADCGNRVAKQRSEIWVGTYREVMVDGIDIPSGPLSWRPMDPDDDLSQRIDDVSEALGRTAAHELSHSLGLVGSSGTCSWMRGCDDGHNCDQFDLDFDAADRFDRGRYIMDPGEKTTNHARLAEPNPNGRAAIRPP